MCFQPIDAVFRRRDFPKAAGTTFLLAEKQRGAHHTRRVDRRQGHCQGVDNDTRRPLADARICLARWRDSEVRRLLLNTTFITVVDRIDALQPVKTSSVLFELRL